MKAKSVKIVIICIVSIIILYIAFMTGRYSFLIGKPKFLLGNKEQFLVEKASGYMREDGISETNLKEPRLVHTVIIRFRNEGGNVTYEVLLEKTSGELLGWTGF